MTEEWKDVVEYEGIYEVSNTGKVRTKEGKTTWSKLHGVRTWEQRTLRQKISKDNTCRVSLWIDGKERTWLVHRIVAKAFIPKVEGKEYINHKDGNRLNNNVSNLEWCTHEENNNHAFDTGLIKTGYITTLTCIDSGEKLTFRSMAKAGEHLGRNHGYISKLTKQGINKIDGYSIRVTRG